MEVLTEMDEYFNAMSKINMDETVMPYVNGRLVESDTYNKVQKILNTPELEKAHMYCYDLDLENLEECDIMKINNLYKLGVDRGFIDDDLQYQDAPCTDPDAEGPKAEEPVEPAPVNPRAKVPCFVAMYSAMKDGQIKTGEAYSRAISVQAAKADVMAQLAKFGYTNISILAIEATEEDACACTIAEGAGGAAAGALGGAVAGNAVGGPVGAAIGTAAGAALGSKLGEDDYLKGRVHNGHLPETEDVEEDDMLDGRPHNNHIPEAEEDESADDSAEDTSDDASDDTAEDTAEDTIEDTADDSAEETSEETSDGDDSVEDIEVDSTEDTEDAEDSDDSDAEEENTSDDADSEDADDDSSEEDADDSDSDEEKEELDDNKKADLKDNYKKIFKNTMLKCKFEEKSFDDLTLKEKVKFFTELSKTWKEDYEPSDFMSDKEVDQLNKIVVKK